MADYLGELGQLVRLGCASRESVSAGSRYVEQVSVEGMRSVQRLAPPPRTWAVTWDVARREEVAALADFVTGGWGPGPWHWVPLAAHRGNLLTPAQAGCRDRVNSAAFTDGGPMRTTDGGIAPTSVVSSLASGWTRMWQSIPALPGTPVTFSADVEGAGARIIIEARDSSGASLSTAGASSSASSVARVSVTLTPPAAAASIAVGVQSTVSRLTRPQVTWTAGPVPFARGAGCRAAVIDADSEDLLALWGQVDYRTSGFTVREVG